MPPKKNKEKGKGKGKGKKEKKLPSPPSKIPDLDPQSKAFYRYQIETLETKILRYQRRCDEMEHEMEETREHIKQTEIDKRDLVEYWKRLHGELEEDLAALTEKQRNNEHKSSNEKEAFLTKIRDMGNQYTDMKDELSTEVASLQRQLIMLEEFKNQREELMEKLKDMEIALRGKDEETKEKIYQIEKKSIQYQDSLKKEMIVRIEKLAVEFRKYTNKQMSETTKRTIRENIAMNAQISKLTDRTISLMQENQELKKKETDLKRNLEIKESMEKDYSKRHLKDLSVIKELYESHKTKVKSILDLKGREVALLNAAEGSLDLESNLGDVRLELAETQEVVNALKEDNDVIMMSLTRQDDVIRHLRDVIQRATSAISDALSETPSVMGHEDIVSEASIPSINKDFHFKVKKDNDADTNCILLQKRTCMLNNLLAILDTAAEHGMGQAVASLGRQTPEDGEGSCMRKMNHTSGPENISHYRVGDAGIVPRSNKRIAAASDQAASIHTQNLARLYTPLLKTVGCQTISSTMARAFANEINKANNVTIPKNLQKYEVLGNGPDLRPVKLLIQRKAPPLKPIHKDLKVEDIPKLKNKTL